jgi:hypothetical protein
VTAFKSFYLCSAGGCYTRILRYRYAVFRDSCICVTFISKEIVRQDKDVLIIINRNCALCPVPVQN